MPNALFFSVLLAASVYVVKAQEGNLHLPAANTSTSVE